MRGLGLAELATKSIIGGTMFTPQTCEGVFAVLVTCLVGVTITANVFIVGLLILANKAAKRKEDEDGTSNNQAA